MIILKRKKEIIIIINSNLTVFSVYAKWLHGFCFFYIELFANSAYRFSVTASSGKILAAEPPG